LNAQKRIERSGKKLLRNVLKRILRPAPLQPEDFDGDSIEKILVVRQDSRVGNLVIMTPLIRGLKTAFPGARLDVLVSEGYEDVLADFPDIDRFVVFKKQGARLCPWSYPLFVAGLRKESYDLAVDVSDGRHFSFNNVLLTALSGARYSLGYDREEAGSFLNLIVPVPPDDIHMADAVFGLAGFLSPEAAAPPMSFYTSDDDKAFAQQWLKECGINEFDAYFVVHPGGRGKKQWGTGHFAELIDRIAHDVGVRMVVIGGRAEDDLIETIVDGTESPFEILQDVTVGQMAAVIERCDMFVSNDTGPMHVAVALNRPTVGIFITSNYHVYGPRGRNSRTVISSHGIPTVDDVFLAVMDLLDVSTGHDGENE